ncbi:MAG: YdbH domain-containing protein [Candidatus Omnitrophota bacterium]
MKIILGVLIVVLISAVAVFFAAGPLLARYAVKELGAFFPGSTSSIEKCSLDLAGRVSFSGVKIGRSGCYEVSLRAVTIAFDLSRLSVGGDPRVHLERGRVEIDLPGKEAARARDYVKMASGGSGKFFVVREADFTGINVKIAAADLSLEGTFSGSLDLEGKQVNYLSASLDSMRRGDLALRDLTMSAGQLLPPGDISIGEVAYGDFKVKDIRGKARFKERSFLVEGISAALFGGRLEADGGIGIDATMNYFGNFAFNGLDIAEFVNEGKMSERFTMSGKAAGKLAFTGSGPAIGYLRGDLATLAPGGQLTITDKKFLADMAARTHQPYAVIEGSLEKYGYKIGKMRAALNGADLEVTIALEGDTGKRELCVVMHDSFLRKE